jgi:hypothetical protein
MEYNPEIPLPLMGPEEGINWEQYFWIHINVSGKI